MFVVPGRVVVIILLGQERQLYVFSMDRCLYTVSAIMVMNILDKDRETNQQAINSIQKLSRNAGRFGFWLQTDQ